MQEPWAAGPLGEFRWSRLLPPGPGWGWGALTLAGPLLPQKGDRRAEEAGRGARSGKMGGGSKTENDSPPQDSFLENPMDRGAWWATVRGVSKSQARRSDRRYASWQKGLRERKSRP